MRNFLRRFDILALILFFVSSVTPSYALPVAGVLPAPALDNTKIGIVAAVRGSVQIASPQTVGRDVTSGESIHLGDIISTDQKGNLQILLLDQTIFTIGPNSAMTIDRFVYDPATQNGQLNAKVVKGVFRFVTGKIGHKNPENMNVDLPSGTIGIRGTIVAGRVLQERALVVLLGPGDRNNTQSRHGRIRVGNAGRFVNVSRAGFGTTVEGNNPPSNPFEVSQDEINGLNRDLSSNPSGNSEGEDEQANENSATDQSGQDLAESGEASEETTLLNLLSERFSKEEDGLAQDTTDNAAEEARKGLPDGITRFKDFQLRAPSILNYAQTANKLFNRANGAAGSYDIFVKLDLSGTAPKLVGGGESKIDVNLTASSTFFTINLPETVFGDPDAPAVFHYSAPSSAIITGCTLGSCSADVTLGFLNLNKEAGAAMVYEITVQRGSDSGVGAGTAPATPDSGAGAI